VTQRESVLVTGATGVVGVEIVARLARAGRPVLALIHRNQQLTLNNGRRLSTSSAPDPQAGAVSCLQGDLTQPGLGLDPADYQRLRSQIGLVVHSAAVVDFGRPRELYETVNVEGTSRVLEFCQDGPGAPVPLVHVSTAYVAGQRRGAIYERELDEGQRFANYYEESKFQAEGLVRDAAGSLPAAIVRPSIVVGASRSGAIRDFKVIYAVLKTLTEGRVRSIPAHYGATLDLVPIDWVADVVTSVALRFDEAVGQTFHAVGTEAITLRDLSDVLAEYPSLQAPRFLPPEIFDLDRLPALERKYYDRIVSLYESYFTCRMSFSDDATAKFMGSRPQLRRKPFLRRLLDYAIRVGFLGRPLPGVEEVLADLAANEPAGSTRALAAGA
jgi:thioester reductase-like protein